MYSWQAMAFGEMIKLLYSFFPVLLSNSCTTASRIGARFDSESTPTLYRQNGEDSLTRVIKQGWEAIERTRPENGRAYLGVGRVTTVALTTTA